MTILVPSHGPDDWRDLLADPGNQWREGFSAKSAALSWENARGLPPEVAAVIGPDARLLLAIPEHKVPLPGGGRPSQCDVFALVSTPRGSCAVSVEAKVAEPFGPTIGDWLKEASSGKHARLEAICALLGCALPPANLRYQLFHRSAAAVVEAGRFGTAMAAMVVQSFSPERLWHGDFLAFAAHLGMDATQGPAERALPDGRPFRLGWASSPLPLP